MKSIKNHLLPFFLLLLGSGIQAFGLYNIHSQADVTEGGVLGLCLVFKQWWDVSPAITGFLLNAACYLFGAKALGKRFVLYSITASVGFSALYRVCECFPPVYPEIASSPLVAAILGALFIGVGAGLCVRIGGAACGDDALAMGLSHITGLDIKWIYLASDLTVLTLSLSYIPLQRIMYSLLTVVLSGQIISLFQKIKIKEKTK